VVGRGRVTVREGRQVVLYPQLAAAAPAVQSINGSSAGVGPSLAGQLRAKAHCHRRLQLIVRNPPSEAGIPGLGTAEQSAPFQLTDVYHGLGRRFPGISGSSRAAAR
jgi:hypothetical protein